jgi:hypothetical protein
MALEPTTECFKDRKEKDTYKLFKEIQYLFD